MADQQNDDNSISTNINDSSLQKAIEDSKDPAKLLVSILRGEVKADKIIKFIRTGNKLDNHAMHVLLASLKNDLGYDYEKLLKIYLALDKAVEQENLTVKIIEDIKKNPEILDEILNEEE